LKISIKDQEFVLHPYGSLFWENQQMLIVADLHLGKIEHFRKHGSALPDLSNAMDYINLEQNIQEFQPQRVVFLGDLFHSALNKSWRIFEEWTKRQPVDFSLIVGNHDVIPVSKFEDLGFDVDHHLTTYGFCLTHKPEDTQGFNICGHIHPGFKLRGKGRQYLNLPCFYQKENQLILPAFGQFTGNYYITPEEEEHVYVCSENDVMQVV
jgi:DNA ligase-associated metallophosphoesterase